VDIHPYAPPGAGLAEPITGCPIYQVVRTPVLWWLRHRSEPDRGSSADVGSAVASDPRTVAALATRAGLATGTPVSGTELHGLDKAELDRLVDRTTVLCRVAPEQTARSSRAASSRTLRAAPPRPDIISDFESYTGLAYTDAASTTRPQPSAPKPGCRRSSA
jgi:hypothetical protein